MTKQRDRQTDRQTERFQPTAAQARLFAHRRSSAWRHVLSTRHVRSASLWKSWEGGSTGAGGKPLQRMLNNWSCPYGYLTYETLPFVQAFSVVLIDFVTVDACSICRTVDIDVIWHIGFKLYESLSIRGVFRERPGGIDPQSSIELIFLTKNNGFVGTVLSTRSVLCTSNMPKMRWRPGLRPRSCCGSSRRSPRSSSRLGRRTPLPNPHSPLLSALLAPRFSRLQRSASVPPM